MNFLPWPQTKRDVFGNAVTLATLCAGEWERGRGTAGEGVGAAAVGAGQALEGKFPLSKLGGGWLLPSGQSEGSPPTRGWRLVWVVRPSFFPLRSRNSSSSSKNTQGTRLEL